MYSVLNCHKETELCGLSPSDRRLSAKLLPTFVDRLCHVVSEIDPYGPILGFLYRFELS
jgi:hypothetical protein